ncbi:fatty acid--CoA ligase [Streptomyces sp. NRRL F-4489]|uniref:FadD3 family acyl-CoA ligase n=1 Tax=Streptomyces sp. NRRL F-4489 TaxID=1609095 RepID=UPI0007466B4D|nr:FadD3 family acyl-CoA ligase [Streptomyces sp. NRRL F-4489]KUL35009.1 fatty acid--CoA ligase [Streptomyces sp. NRRL F-4489]
MTWAHHHSHEPPQPAAPETVAALAAHAARVHGDREALADGEVRWTFAQLAAEITAAARAAVAHGIRHGDRIAVWAPNSRQWITAVLGAVSVGAVLVPLNTRYKAAEAADIIRRSGATRLFTARGFLGCDYDDLLHDSGEDLGGLRGTVVLRDDGPPGRPARPGTLSYADYLAAGHRVGDAELAARTAAVRPDDLADILFTSGTTGRPKGVLATHGQTMRVFDAWARLVTLRPGDRYLLVNPFFHTFGYKAGVLACLLRGATMLPEAVYDADRILRRTAEERVSVLMGPPTVFHGLLNHPDRARHRLSSLRLAGTGAALVPAELVVQIREQLGIPDVFTAYGLTESAGVVTVCPTDADAETLAHTVGLPLPGTELRIVDPAGRPLPPGEPGEVVVRGYHVMPGYLDDPAATAAAVDPDGWLHTGDVGVLDDRGFLTLTDRLKDMYVVGGFNAYPAEVERVLRGHPEIADVAVVGAPDARLGEVGVAFVVPAAGSAPDPGELNRWARERLANFKVPRRYHLVPELPRNAGGKVLKGELRRTARNEGRNGG